MKPHVLLITASVLATTLKAQTTHLLTNSGTTFSPNVITMQAGDSIHLVLPSPHTCREVDQSTWEANGNTSNGGFQYPSGDTTFVMDVPGTYYYVCILHAGMGMKGQFIVEDASGIAAATELSQFRLVPNPAGNEVRITHFECGQTVQVRDASLKLVLAATPASDGTLNISALKAGHYTLELRDARSQWSVSLPLVVAR
jgi:plastocyanin